MEEKKKKIFLNPIQRLYAATYWQVVTQKNPSESPRGYSVFCSYIYLENRIKQNWLVASFQNI